MDDGRGRIDGGAVISAVAMVVIVAALILIHLIEGSIGPIRG